MTEEPGAGPAPSRMQRARRSYPAQRFSEQRHGRTPDAMQPKEFLNPPDARDLDNDPRSKIVAVRGPRGLKARADRPASVGT